MIASIAMCLIGYEVQLNRVRILESSRLQVTSVFKPDIDLETLRLQFFLATRGNEGTAINALALADNEVRQMSGMELVEMLDGCNELSE